MFHPNDWKACPIIIDKGYVLAYRNKTTGLLKLKATFTHEQQRALETYALVRRE